jgi:glycosyltransferase involved in cell wall biosynthesis
MFFDKCEDAGVLALPHTSAETLVKLFNASKTCTITSYTNGGSQRTVLEAMAMNIPLVACADSEKTSEYVHEAGEGKLVPTDPRAIQDAIIEMSTKTVNTRDYIMSKWSEEHYANALDKWICGK